MKVERNILNKKNLAELENLVNCLDKAVEKARQGIFSRLLERKTEEKRKALIKEIIAVRSRIKEKKERLAKLREK